MLDGLTCGGDDVNREEQRYREHGDQRQDGAKLPVEVGVGPVSNPAPDLLHFGRALVVAQDLLTQEDGVAQPEDRDGERGVDRDLLKGCQVSHV